MPKREGREAREAQAEGSAEGGGVSMSAEEFARVRSILGRSRRELAAILGLSPKAVESYEQGWRRVPPRAAKTLYFLLFKIEGKRVDDERACWEVQGCPPERRAGCVAHLAGEGRYCWFFTGKLCARSGGCTSCPVFAQERARIDGPPIAAEPGDREGGGPGGAAGFDTST